MPKLKVWQDRKTGRWHANCFVDSYQSFEHLRVDLRVWDKARRVFLGSTRTLPPQRPRQRKRWHCAAGCGYTWSGPLPASLSLCPVCGSGMVITREGTK